MFSGVFKSQVIDVIQYLENEFAIQIQLISFVPRGFVEDQKKRIQAERPNAIVLPITFGLSRWKLSGYKLKRIADSQNACIARGVFATALAQKHFRFTIYDGRAAVKSEVEEYDVAGGNKKISKALIAAERQAVLHSDFRIAVSQKLVNYWSAEYQYNLKDHAIIPCTLTSMSSSPDFNQTQEIKLVYSGGTGPWQSFDLLTQLLRQFLDSNSSAKVDFMTKGHKEIDQLQMDFPNRVRRLWVDHSEVFEHLSSADYGILIREDKMTNQVASPVKFAEYLSAGLKVLISPNVGDYSDLVQKNNLGYLIDDHIPNLEKPNLSEKKRMVQFCEEHLSKKSESIRFEYQKLLMATGVI